VYILKKEERLDVTFHSIINIVLQFYVKLPMLLVTINLLQVELKWLCLVITFIIVDLLFSNCSLAMVCVFGSVRWLESLVLVGFTKIWINNIKIQYFSTLRGVLC